MTTSEVDQRASGLFGLAAAALLLGAACGLLAQAQPAAADLEAAARVRALVAKIERRYRAAPPFKVAFVQRYESATFGSAEQAEGVMHVAPPSRILWRYDRPRGQRGALDGDHYWLIVPEDQQVLVRQLDAAAGDPLAELLAGRLDLSGLFLVRRADGPARPGRARLDLTPRTPREDFEHALLEVEERDGTLRSLELSDPLGNRILIRLDAPQPADPPPDEAFELAVPRGFTLIGD